jgi:hypothetical protein
MIFKIQAESCVMSRAIISRLMLVCWKGLLRYYTLCCGVLYKYNLLDVICWLLAAFFKVVQVMCFKDGYGRSPPLSFRQLHGLRMWFGQIEGFIPEFSCKDSERP